MFDLEKDPSEKRNVAHRHPEIVRRLKDAYENLLQEVPEFEPPDRDPVAGLETRLERPRKDPVRDQ